LGLTGIFDIGSSNSRTTTEVPEHPAVSTDASAFTWGLDLNIRTYILDPRFISLTFEPSFHRGSGNTDAQGNQERDIGGTFYIDFLKASFTPFRFHFIDHSLSYEQEHFNSESVARRSIGFDWTFRKPKLPPLFINYDKSRFDYEFTLTPASVTQTSSLLAGTQGSFQGWSVSAAYSRQTSTEAFTGVGTSTELVRGSANRYIWPGSQITTTALYERLSFSNPGGNPGLNIPFWSYRTDIRTRHTERLSTMFSHQYYRTGAEMAAPADPSGSRFEMSSTSFNDLRGSISYRITSSITVTGSGDTAFLSAPDSTIETAARTSSFSGGIHWQRKIKIVQTRAGLVEGTEFAKSNLGNSRRIPFTTANAGVSVGEPRRLLVSADGFYSDRPDLFEIGGRFIQREATASLESQALKKWRLRASATYNEYEYLTLRGHERFHNRAYSGSISRSIFSLTAARNSDASLRNLLQD